jgi:hypothetical protein
MHHLRQIALRAAEPFWQARNFDFNVWSEPGAPGSRPLFGR